MYVTVSLSDLRRHLCFFFGGTLRLHMLSPPDHAFTYSTLHATWETICILPLIPCYVSSIGACWVMHCVPTIFRSYIENSTADLCIDWSRPSHSNKKAESTMSRACHSTCLQSSITGQTGLYCYAPVIQQNCTLMQTNFRPLMTLANRLPNMDIMIIILHRHSRRSCQVFDATPLWSKHLTKLCRD